MCGRYYIAPDEEEEDWEEIARALSAILTPSQSAEEGC